MKENTHRIFREEAVRRYSLGREQAVLPKFTSPQSLFLFWILSGLLLCGAVLVWLVRVPARVAGIAVAARSAPAGGESIAGDAVIAFLPPDTLGQLRPGQKLFVRVDKGSRDFGGSIVSVGTEVVSPSEAREKFGLSDEAAAQLKGPSAVAVAGLGTRAGDLPASAPGGGAYSVEVEVGTQRAFSLLPRVK